MYDSSSKKSSLSTLKISARWCFLVVLTFVLFTQLNGIGETLSPWSRATVNLFSRLFYSEKGKDFATVLLFSEADIENISRLSNHSISFPIPYETHIEVLDALSRREPAAIMVDFAFMDNRKGDDVNALIEELCTINAYKTKVYLSTFNFWQPNHGLRKEIYLKSKNHDESNGCYRIVPVSYKPEKDGFAHQFDLWQYNNNKELKYKSAVLSIYQNTSLGSKTVNDAFDAPIDILWGVSKPKNSYSDTPCEKFNFFQTLVHLIKDGPNNLFVSCPYSNNISVHSLLYETSDDIDLLIKDKIIFYGGAFKGSSDIIKSPAHGDVPGVYLLAMAFDNLTVYGKNYKKAGNHSLAGWINVPIMIDLLIISLGVTFYFFVKAMNKINAYKFLYIQYETTPEQKVIIVEKFCDLAWFIILFTLCLSIFYLFDYGPRNFWAFIVFLSVTSSLDMGLEKLNEHTSKGRWLEIKSYYKTPWSFVFSGFVGIVCMMCMSPLQSNCDNLFTIGIVYLLTPTIVFLIITFISMLYSKSAIQKISPSQTI